MSQHVIPSIKRSVSGVEFDDPFFWLEEESAQALAWQEDQNRRTDDYLSALPSLDELRDRIESAGSRRFVYAPLHRGDHWFRLGIGTNGLVVEVSKTPTGEARVIADPGALAEEGVPAALDWFYPSPRGTYVAFGASFAGDEQS